MVYGYDSWSLSESKTAVQSEKFIEREKKRVEREKLAESIQRTRDVREDVAARSHHSFPCMRVSGVVVVDVSFCC